MRIVIIGLLYIVFMLLRCPMWLASPDVPYVLRAAVYPFFHTSIIHLAINSLSVWFVWPGKDKKRDIRNFFTAFLISFLVYPMGFRPCVGISNMLFAACGLRLRPSWLKTTNGIILLALMLVMCFFPQFAGTNHLAAFALGLAVSGLRRSLQPLMKDVRRFTADR